MPFEIEVVSDVYAFAQETAPDLVETFKGHPVDEVRFLGNVTGPYSAFAVLMVDDLKRLPALLPRVFAPSGEDQVETAKPIAFGQRAIRRTRLWAKFAYVRIRAQARQAMAVLEAINDRSVQGYNGSAIVLGDFDLLVEVGADDEAQLYERLLNVNAVSGIVSTDTAFVLDDLYYYKETT